MEFRSLNLKYMIIRCLALEFVGFMKLTSFAKQALDFIEQIATFISSFTFITFVKITVEVLLGQSLESVRIEELKKQ